MPSRHGFQRSARARDIPIPADRLRFGYAEEMKHTLLSLAAIVLGASLALGGRLRAPASSPEEEKAAYLGFDRNTYPGDERLAGLRKTFSYTGYWLNLPPGASANTWEGRRAALRAVGFGFLVLFNGRLDAELKKAADCGDLARSDAAAAIADARREGFPKGTIIFLDQEEGGRMLPEQTAYINAWADGINAGGFRAGVYCSGVPVPESRGVTVVTADDIRQNSGVRRIAYWVANDACPPSPGCAFPKHVPLPAKSGVRFAEVWQFAQSPRRQDVAGGCKASYDCDGNCYAPGEREHRLFVDLNSATSQDPSEGR